MPTEVTEIHLKVREILAPACWFMQLLTCLPKKNWIKSIQEKVDSFLHIHQVDVTSPQVSETILKHYQNDFTFSVPILAMCGLCRVPGKSAFSHIPQLPFELALPPSSFYRILNLNVVSYAIPALIAAGTLIFKKKILFPLENDPPFLLGKSH